MTTPNEAGESVTINRGTTDYVVLVDQYNYIRVFCLACMMPGPTKYPPSEPRPLCLGAERTVFDPFVSSYPSRRVLSTPEERALWANELIEAHEAECHAPSSERCGVCGRITAVPDAAGHCHAGRDIAGDPIDCDGKLATIDTREALMWQRFGEPLRTALREMLDDFGDCMDSKRYLEMRKLAPSRRD